MGSESWFLHPGNRSSNVLGMNLTIPVSYIEDRSQLVRTHTLAEVVRVQRSQSGFKTSTGTTRTCEKCREGERGVSGVESWPTATWLLTGEVFGDRRRIQWALCSDHFKELRDEEQRLREKRGEWEYGRGDLDHGAFSEPDLAVWEPLSNPHS